MYYIYTLKFSSSSIGANRVKTLYSRSYRRNGTPAVFCSTRFQFDSNNNII